jgi:hypothetical protein
MGMKKFLISLFLAPLTLLAANPSFQDVTNVISGSGYNLIFGTNPPPWATNAASTNYSAGNNIVFTLTSTNPWTYSIAAVIPPNTNALTSAQTNVIKAAVTNIGNANFAFNPTNYALLTNSQVWTGTNWFAIPVLGSDSGATTITAGAAKQMYLQMPSAVSGSNPVSVVSASASAGSTYFNMIVGSVNANQIAFTTSTGGTYTPLTAWAITSTGELLPNNGSAQIGDSFNPVSIVYANSIQLANYISAATLQISGNAYVTTGVFTNIASGNLTLSGTGTVPTLNSTTASIGTESVTKSTIQNLLTTSITNGFMVFLQSTNPVPPTNSPYVYVAVDTNASGYIFVSSNISKTATAWIRK